MRVQERKTKGKPRLLIIINRFVIGGQAADTISLAWNLKDDFEIIILHGEKEKDEAEPSFLLQKYPAILKKRISWLKKTVNPFNDIIAFFSILYLIFKFKPDIVHTHGAKPGVTGRLAAWVARVPVIIHTFHGHLFHSYFSKSISGFIVLAERALGQITATAIALSESQKNELVNEYRIFPDSKIKVIQLGFDFNENEDQETLRETFRKKYNLLDDDIAIGIVGRIVPVKNHSFFVKVIHAVLSSGTANSPAFFITGDGDLKMQVEEQLLQKNISFNNKTITSQNRVVFTSWLTNIGEVMNGLDIVVLTSLNEGTPLSIIEAQFYKKPVVATNAGGVKDSLQDGITGFLAEKNDIVLFSKKLSALIDDKELRQTMGEAGNKFASATFSKQKEVTAIKNLYLSLLKKKEVFFNKKDFYKYIESAKDP